MKKKKKKRMRKSVCQQTK